ncbi:MAG: TIGR03087 family PEP-CTERM/XrtA system glycosyltransferase [Vicinamibacterales bacterium]
MRVLVLTHRLPYAPNRGDRVRAYHVLQMLKTKVDLELVSFVHDAEEASHGNEVRAFVPQVTTLMVPELRKYGRAMSALAHQTPLTHALLDAPDMTSTLRRICAKRRPDVVLAYCSGMARFALEPPLDEVPFVLDFVDVDSQKWRDLARTATVPLAWLYRREAETLGAFEARAATRAKAALVVNGREAAIARALAPEANVVVMQNGVDADRLAPAGPPADNARVVFCGVMNYAPNDEGMRWFVRDTWPLVKATRPDATLAIVGSDPTPALKALCASDASIAVTGRVADVRPWLWESAVAVAPLRVARGVQNKVLEAIGAGLPTVITEAVATGLPPEVACATSVANSPASFARHVVELLALMPEQRRERAARGRLDSLKWESTLSQLWPLLKRASIQSQSAA